VGPDSVTYTVDTALGVCEIEGLPVGSYIVAQGFGGNGGNPYVTADVLPTAGGIDVLLNSTSPGYVFYWIAVEPAS
jgi:hypothetical protein